jgi:hypothetical protein
MTIHIKRDTDFKKALDQNIAHRYKSRKRTSNVIHVSDILQSSCPRKAFYSRKLTDVNDITPESMIHFIRGESAETVLSSILNIGVSQATLQLEELVAHPDLMHRNGGEEDMIIELKDSNNFFRLEPSDLTFQSYMHQLICYLIIAVIEKGILCIKYNLSEMEYIQRSEAGTTYLKPHDGKKPEIETWSITLPLDDEVRNMLREQMLSRKDRLLEALQNNEVKSLPRLTGDLKRLKCGSCVFKDRCWNQDFESLDAMKWDADQNRLDPLKMNGVVKVDDGK